MYSGPGSVPMHAPLPGHPGHMPPHGYHSGFHYGQVDHFRRFFKISRNNFIELLNDSRKNLGDFEKMEINDFGDIDIDIRLNKDKIIKLIKLKPYGID